MTLLSKLWPGLSIALIVLFLWLKSGCNTPVVDTATIKMDALKAGWDSAKRQDKPVEDSLRGAGDSIAIVLTGERKRRQSAENGLQARAVDLRRTLAALDAARSHQDTTQRLRQGDTLEAQVIAGIPAVEDFKRLTDSMGAAYIALVVVKDSIIGRQASLLQVADTTILRQRQQFNVVDADDVKKTKQLKIFKPVAIGGVIFALITIAAGFLHH